MARNPVNWFEIYCDDLERARAFYETLLGIELQPLAAPDDALSMLAFPSDGQRFGTSGALVQVDGMAAGGNSILVYFSCDDCGVEEARVASAGGELVRPKMSIGDYGFISLLKDTEGKTWWGCIRQPELAA